MHIHPKQHILIKDIEIFKFLGFLPPIKFPAFDFKLIGLSPGWKLPPGMDNLDIDYENHIKYSFHIRNGFIWEIRSPIVHITSNTHDFAKIPYSKYYISSNKIESSCYLNINNLNNTLEHVRSDSSILNFL